MNHRKHPKLKLITVETPLGLELDLFLIEVDLTTALQRSVRAAYNKDLPLIPWQQHSDR